MDFELLVARDRAKSKVAFRAAPRMLRGLLPSLLLMVGLIGIIVGLLPPATVALIMPPVLIMMGLFEVWVPRSLIQQYLGGKSGVTGVLLALLFGTAPTGPLYIAFRAPSGRFAPRPAWWSWPSSTSDRPGAGRGTRCRACRLRAPRTRA